MRILNVCLPAMLAIMIGATSATGNDDEPSGGKPKIYVEQTEIDLGTLREGQKATTTFILENRGDAQLEIDRIKPKCGCTTTQMDGYVIPPGGKLEMPVTFNSRRRLGENRVQINVFTTDPDNPLTILYIRALVERLYEVRPSSFINLRSMRKGKSITRSVDIYPSKDNTKLELLTFSLDHESITYKCEPASDGVRQGVRAEITIGDDAPIGLLTARVAARIKVGDEDSQVTITIRGNVIGDITLKPHRISSFDPQPRGSQLRSVEVRTTADAPLEIHAVQVGPQLEATVIDGPDGSQKQIELQIADDAPSGPFGTVLEIYTNNVDQPCFAIPIYGNVEPAIEVLPRRVLLKSAPVAGSGTDRKVRVRGSTPDPFDITAITCSEPFLKVEPPAGGTVGKDAYTFVFSVSDPSQPGVYDATVTMTTTVPGEERLTIPVRIEME